MENNLKRLIGFLEKEIVNSAHKTTLTIRTGDYRIGLRKAIDEAYKISQEELDHPKESLIKDWCMEALVNDYISRHRSSFVELDIPTDYKKQLLYKLGISTDILDY